MSRTLVVKSYRELFQIIENFAGKGCRELEQNCRELCFAQLSRTFVNWFYRELFPSLSFKNSYMTFCRELCTKLSCDYMFSIKRCNYVNVAVFCGCAYVVVQYV